MARIYAIIFLLQASFLGFVAAAETDSEHAYTLFYMMVKTDSDNKEDCVNELSQKVLRVLDIYKTLSLGELNYRRGILEDRKYWWKLQNNTSRELPPYTLNLRVQFEYRNIKTKARPNKGYNCSLGGSPQTCGMYLQNENTGEKILCYWPTQTRRFSRDKYMLEIYNHEELSSLYK